MRGRPPVLVGRSELVMNSYHFERDCVFSKSELSLSQLVCFLFVGQWLLHVLKSRTLLASFGLLFKLVCTRANFFRLADPADLGERIFPKMFGRFDFAGFFHFLSVHFSRLVRSGLELFFIQVLSNPPSLVRDAVATLFTSHPCWLRLFGMSLLLTVPNTIVFPLYSATHLVASCMGKSSGLRHSTGLVCHRENRILCHSSKLHRLEWSLNSEAAFDCWQSQRSLLVFQGHFCVFKIVKIISSLCLSLRSELLNYVSNLRRFHIFLPQL